MRGIVIGLIVLLSGPAFAGGWQGAFPASALESHLPGSDLEVWVAASARPGSADAALALLDALITLPAVRGARIAEDGPSDDAGRLAWALRRYRGVLFFVRVERDADDRPSAVVSRFDAGGNAAGAFVASPDDPLRPRRSGSPLAASIAATDAGPLPRPSVVIPRDHDGRPRLDEAYALYPGYRGGKGYREPLAAEQLYQSLDRPDWADAYAARRRLRHGLIAGGSVLVGLGLLAAGSATISGGISYSVDGGDHSHAVLTGGGIALGVSVGAGVAFILAGKLLSRHPVSASKVARVAARRADQGHLATLGAAP
jgi:hypothetical protein